MIKEDTYNINFTHYLEKVIEKKDNEMITIGSLLNHCILDIKDLDKEDFNFINSLRKRISRHIQKLELIEKIKIEKKKNKHNTYYYIIKQNGKHNKI